MGEIAEMMLDGTMDWETGEWNFDGEDGPGFPMTGAQARDYRAGKPIGDDAALLKRREARRRYRRNRAARRAAERSAQS